jgi:hypothetical protein
VPQVAVVINCDAAGVEADLAGGEGLEGFFASGQGVVQVHDISRCPFNAVSTVWRCGDKAPGIKKLKVYSL